MADLSTTTPLPLWAKIALAVAGSAFSAVGGAYGYQVVAPGCTTPQPAPIINQTPH